MNEPPVRIDRPWLPLLVAIGLSGMMMYLASGPFDELLRPDVREGQVVVEVPFIEVISPVGTVDGFPTRFEWADVPGATGYVVGVAAVNGDAVEPLFRQQGRGAVLDVGFEAGAEPPAGNYAWEVYALGADGVPVAKGSGEFVVR